MFSWHCVLGLGLEQIKHFKCSQSPRWHLQCELRCLLRSWSTQWAWLGCQSCQPVGLLLRCNQDRKTSSASNCSCHGLRVEPLMVPLWRKVEYPFPLWYLWEGWARYSHLRVCRHHLGVITEVGQQRAGYCNKNCIWSALTDWWVDYGSKLAHSNCRPTTIRLVHIRLHGQHWNSGQFSVALERLRTRMVEHAKAVHHRYNWWS
jgi:hypothetical protein